MSDVWLNRMMLDALGAILSESPGDCMMLWVPYCVALMVTGALGALLCESPGDCMMLQMPYCVNLVVIA